MREGEVRDLLDLKSTIKLGSFVILYIKQRFGSGISTNISDTLAKKVFAIQFDHIVLPFTYGHHV